MGEAGGGSPQPSSGAVMNRDTLSLAMFMLRPHNTISYNVIPIERRVASRSIPRVALRRRRGSGKNSGASERGIPAFFE